MKGFAVDGATTNHGGVIRATQQFHNHMGLPLLRAGDGHYCPQCKCWSTIQKSHDHVIFEGQPVAYEDDLLSCGAKIMHQQSHMVGDSQGSFTISFGELPQSEPKPQPTPTYQDYSSLNGASSFSSKSEDDVELTDDDKILTEEEANQIFQRCFKQTVTPMTTEHRVLATKMYWEAVGNAPAIAVLQTIFEKVIGGLGNVKKPSKLDGAVLVYKGGSLAKGALLNSKRMKYFQVKNYGTIDKRFGSIGQAVTAGIQAGFRRKFDMLNAGI